MSNPEQLPQPAAVPVSYTCPGELYSISREIHLARLAAYYFKCRDCEHRHETGHHSPPAIEQQEDSSRFVVRSRLITDENVRGVYLNELDRNRAIAWGEAWAAALWDLQPMMASRGPDDPAQIIAERPIHREKSTSRGPVVVVGFDERPSSPEIISGAVLGLRRIGCPVIDLGQTALPAWAFQINSLEADAGLYVTGAGCDASWTGFEFLSRGAMPIPSNDLQKLQSSVEIGVSRQTRQIGSHRPLQGLAEYEASLESHFHAIRPLRIVCGSSTRLMSRLLDRLFAKLPCELTFVPLPTRRRILHNSRDIDLVRIATNVVEGQHHLGLIIDEDSQHIAFVTDRGRLVTSQQVGRLLIELSQRENPDACHVVATSWEKEAAHWIDGRRATVVDGGESTTSLVQTLIDRGAVLALSADGRVWFRRQYPSCDALLVLSQILRALSLSDAPFSEVVARLQQ